jgi:hypothetical protein
VPLFFSSFFFANHISQDKSFEMSDYPEQDGGYGRDGGRDGGAAKKEPGPDEVKLFVGNLSFEVS